MLRTPLRRSAWLSARTGGEVFLKLETLQPTFSYKIRGALNAVLRLVEQTRASGAGHRGPASERAWPRAGVPASPAIERPAALVTASAGNHGRALAHAARLAGLTLTVYVPETAPRTKLEAIRSSGAGLRLCRDYDEAERRAKEHGAVGPARFISPYSDPDVIAGAGTVGLEILEERPDVDTIVVPVGGGGLISGIAIAAKHMSRTASVAGVEVEASCPFTRSLAAGRIVQINVKPTLADGLAGNLDPDTMTFDLVRKLVDRIVTVTEAQLTSAVADVVCEERLVAEGAAATGIAALLAGHIDARDRRVAAVLTGGNIDSETLARILAGR